MTDATEDPRPPQAAAEPGPRQKRARKVVLPFQRRLVLMFSGASLLALLLQFVLMGFRFSELAVRLPSGGEYLAQELPGTMLEVLAVSLALLLPAVVGLGVLITFRIAGPIYRFEQHLRSVSRGERPGPCRIRTGDELQGFCNIMNEALEVARREGPVEPAREAGPAPRREVPPVRAAG